MIEIGELLRQALAMTEKVAQGTGAEEDVEKLIERRGSLIEQASEARAAGVPWGEQEARLAQRIVALDSQLVERLWQSRREAFAWLTERQPELLDDLPCLREIATNSVSP